MKDELNTCCPTETKTETTTQVVRPHYELDRNDEAFRLKIYVPGSKKSDVNIAIDNGLLTISAKRSDQPAEGWRPLRTELQRRDYRLEVRVPEKVDIAAIGASVEDGILTLTLPIREADKPRSIEIN